MQIYRVFPWFFHFYVWWQWRVVILCNSIDGVDKTGAGACHLMPQKKTVEIGRKAPTSRSSWHILTFGVSSCCGVAFSPFGTAKVSQNGEKIIPCHQFSQVFTSAPVARKLCAAPPTANSTPRPHRSHRSAGGAGKGVLARTENRGVDKNLEDIMGYYIRNSLFIVW
jgi:hypothetical protein